MTYRPEHITFILNPVAGRGRAKGHLVELRSLLSRYEIDHTLHVTTRKGEAIELSAAAARKGTMVVAVGGDGTVNEVARGVMGTSAVLGVIGEGSGNDFARMAGGTNDIPRMLERFRNSNVKQFDAGKAVITRIHGKKDEQYFFNSLGIGFDAAVAKKVSAMRWLKGFPLYVAALARTLAGYRPHDMTVTTPHGSWRKDYFLLCCGIGRWEGGGFMLTPDAEPDDGQFQVCGVYGSSILGVLPVLPFALNGSHKGRSHIDLFDVPAVSVETRLPLTVHGDGEIFGNDIIAVEASIIPSALSVAC